MSRSLRPASLLALLVALFALTASTAAAKAPVALEKTGEISFDSEIVDLLPGGDTMVATNGIGIRFLDASDPDHLVPEETYVPMNGNSTAVAATPDGKYALVGVRRSNKPSDWLVVVDVESRSVVRRIELPKGPDSVAVSPDGKYAAVAIEADESDNYGSIVTVEISDPDPEEWETHNLTIDPAHPELGPGAEYELEEGELAKPQPEFVDINEANEAAVTLQENNAIAIVDLPTATITRIFNLGKRTITAEEIEAGRLGADLDDDELVSFDDPFDAERWPDAVGWADGGKALVVVDEGENLGTEQENGARTFSVWRPDGTLVTEMDDFEYQHSLRGLYQDNRSDNNGVTIEGVDVATFGGREIAFFATERAFTVAAYDISDVENPRLIDVVETGVEPEGIVADPVDNVVYTADEESGTISTVRARFSLDGFEPNRPKLVSADGPWSNAAGLGTDEGGKLLFSGFEGPALIQQVTSLSGPRLPMHVVGDPGLVEDGFLDVARDRFRGWAWATAGEAALRAFDRSGNLRLEVPTIKYNNGNSSSDAFQGLELSADGRFAYLSISRYLIRYEIDTGAVKTLQAAAAHMPTNNFQFHDLSWMPDGRLALLLSRYNRKENARVEAIDPSLFDSLPEAATLPEAAFSTVLELPASEFRSRYGPAALAIRANGDVWIANDADHGGDPDLRRWPQAAARPSVPLPPGAELPSPNPATDITIGLGGQEYAHGVVSGDRALIYDGKAGVSPRHFGPLQAIDPDTGEDLGIPMPAFGIASGTVAIYRVLADGAGGAIVAGLFDTVGGVPHKNIVRIAPDGSVDPGFTLQANGAVRGLLVDGSHLYLGGAFRSLTQGAEAPLAVPGIARVSLATGAPDASWLPKLTYTSTTGYVDRFALGGESLYISGASLKEIDGVAQSRIGAVSTATGARLPFAPSGINSTVADMVTYEGDVIVAGPQTPAYVRRLEPDGTPYAPFDSGLCCQSIYDLELLGGDLFVMGQANQGKTLDDEGEVVSERPGFVLMKLDPETGLFDRAFRDGVVGPEEAAAGAQAAIAGIGGRLIAAGNIADYGGARGDGFASLDPATGAGKFLREGFAENSSRQVAAFGPGGDIALVSGSPSSYSGPYKSPFMQAVELHTDQFDSSWRFGAFLASPNYDPEALAADRGWIYTANFWRASTVDGDPYAENVEQFYRFDPETGEIDSEFEPLVDSRVRDVAFAGDLTYIVGNFGGVGGVGRNRIAAIDRDSGAVDKGFVANANSNAVVNAVVIGPEGNVWVGGQELTSINGTAVDGIAALDPITGAVVAKGPQVTLTNGTPEFVQRMAVHGPSGRIAFYGTFQKVDNGNATSLFFYEPFSGQVVPASPTLSYNQGDRLVAGPQGVMLYGEPTFTGETRRGIVVFDPLTGKRNPDFLPDLQYAAWADFAGNTVVALGQKTFGSSQPLRYLRYEVGAPANTTPPAIAGEPIEGSPLTCGLGSWSNSPSGYQRQWLRNGVELPGAEAEQYVPSAADVGQEIACRVTAQNSAGSAIAVSDPVVPASGSAVNLTPPTITTPVIEGEPVKCDPGTWSGSPDKLKLRWLLDGAEIKGSYGVNHTPAAGTAGHELSCQVTAIRDGVGQTVAVSAAEEVQPGSGAGETTGKVTAGALTASASGQLQVPIACTGAGKCGGKVVVLTKVKGAMVEIGTATFSLPGASGTVPLSLTPSGVKMLEDKGGKAMVTSFRVTIEGGGETETAVNLKIAS